MTLGSDGRPSRQHAQRIALVGVGAAAVYVAWIVTVLALISHGFLGDFRTNVWEAGRAVLASQSPLGEHTAGAGHGSVYPPAATLTTLPFALPPFEVAAILWLFAQIACVAGALRLCGVRDWRCYALALVSPPVLLGLAYGNVSLVVVLALTAIWVWRDRPARVGAVLGIAIAARLFLWPLFLWLLLTRRRRASGVTAASTILSSLIGWAAVGFSRIGEFPDITSNNVSEFLPKSVSLASVVANLGASTSLVFFATSIAGAMALVAAFRVREDDLACLSWVLVAALFMSPIVWPHYYALMLVPLALATPAFSRAWLLPYLTTPQLAFWAAAGAIVFSAATGIAFTIATARHCVQRRLGSARRQDMVILTRPRHWDLEIAEPSGGS